MPDGQQARAIPQRIRNLIVDMDGVLWRGESPSPGLPEFFEVLANQALGCVLATNNSTLSARRYAEKLQRFGVGLPADRILTSGDVTALTLAERYPRGTAVYVVGEDPLREALARRGFSLLERDPPAGQPVAAPLVVVGLDRHVNYARLARAAALVSSGARFVGTNPDVSLPIENGLAPGAGALLAAVSAASGVTPEIVGKPSPLLFEKALDRLGGGKTDTAVVGDRIETDIAGAKAAGLYSILLLSGVTDQSKLAAAKIKPDAVFKDISDLTAAVCQGTASKTARTRRLAAGRGAD